MTGLLSEGRKSTPRGPPCGLQHLLQQDAPIHRPPRLIPVNGLPIQELRGGGLGGEDKVFLENTIHYLSLCFQLRPLLGNFVVSFGNHVRHAGTGEEDALSLILMPTVNKDAGTPFGITRRVTVVKHSPLLLRFLRLVQFFAIVGLVWFDGLVDEMFFHWGGLFFHWE